MKPLTFVGYDEGRQILGLYRTDGATGWQRSLDQWPLARDLQRLSDGRVLVGFDRGYLELDPAHGAVLKVVDRWTGVTSVRRDGEFTLVAGVDLDGPGLTVLTLGPDDQLLATASRPGDYVRLLRTAGPRWLLGADDRFLETTADLSLVRTLQAPGFRHAWMARRRPDGTTLVSAGYGAFLAEFDAEGALVRTFGGVEEVPAFVEPFFYALFDETDEGILVANWQGHGPDHGAQGRQMLAFDAQGRYVDSWSHPEISSLQGFLILEANFSNF